MCVCVGGGLGSGPPVRGNVGPKNLLIPFRALCMPDEATNFFDAVIVLDMGTLLRC